MVAKKPMQRMTRPDSDYTPEELKYRDRVRAFTGEKIYTHYVRSILYGKWRDVPFKGDEPGVTEMMINNRLYFVMTETNLREYLKTIRDCLKIERSMVPIM
jgi:hypothetical protein